MAGIGDGFFAGAQLGSEMRDRKKKREQDERLEAARRELELDKQARDFAAQKERDQGRYSFEGDQSDKDRQFRTGERTATQTWQSGERESGQQFQTGERTGRQGFDAAQSDLERAARAADLDKELAFRKAQSDLEHATNEGRYGWERDPKNPDNALKTAQTDKIRMDLGDPMDSGAAGAPSSGPVVINSEDQFNRLAKGTRFSWNGRVGTKQ